MRLSVVTPWLLLFGLSGYLLWQHFSPVLPSAETAPATVQTAPATVSASGASSYANAVQSASKAVVNIYTKQRIRQQTDPFLEQWLRFHGQNIPREREATSLGSGVIASQDGYIITNAHVVAGADEILVVLHNGDELSATLVGSDPDSDVAVLKVAKDNLPSLPIRSTALAVGDVVLAIGNPFGVGQTVTQGIVSALGRSGLGINTYEDFIQTDAAINPGNSGGALVDAQGNLVGINTAIYSRSGGSLGIGFAIPATNAVNIMQSLIKDGHVSRGWLGIEVASADGAASNGRPQRERVIIAAMLRDGPADKGGLAAGDQVLRIDDTIIDNPAQLVRVIGKTAPGQEVDIWVLRDNREQKFRVRMGARPASQR